MLGLPKHAPLSRLDGRPVPLVDLQSDVAAQALLDWAGFRSIPVVVTTDGTVLIEPSERELAAVIEIRAA